jgi:hypothetical protein
MDVSAVVAQNRLHEEITGLVNGEGRSRRQMLASVISPSLFYTRGARRLARLHGAFHQARPRSQQDAVSLSVPAYAGPNQHVRQMMGELEPLQDVLHGAFVHGSLATAEEIPYSDFDALVILRDSLFTEPGQLATVAARLSSLRRIMFDFDPLQHHGWFVLVEADLRFYCDAYFPAALFFYARSLLPGAAAQVVLAPRAADAEILDAFRNVARKALAEISTSRLPADLYQLKSTLSKIMLLPALYLQARDGTAVYKKFSFELARQDFDPATWSVMDEISALRSDWCYDARPWRRWALSRPLAPRRLVTRCLAPPIPPRIRTRLRPALWTAAAQLIGRMRERLASRAPT